MFSLTRFAKVSYFLAFSFVVFLLLPVRPSQAQSSGPIPSGVTNRSGVTTGFRGVPPINITIPVLSGSSSLSGFGGGFVGFGGGFGGSSFNFQTITINLGSPFPPGWGMPPPTINLPLNNFGPTASLFGFAGFPPFLGFPSYSDSTGAPWSLMTAMGLFGPGGGMTGLGGFGGGGFGFGGLSMLGGFGGGGFGFGGLSMLGGFGGGGFGFGFGGMGGFAGKGFGGFNGRNAL
jgi:hypothetical protein